MPPSSRQAPNCNTPTESLITQFAEIVGVRHALTEPQDQAPYLREWRDRYVGKTPLVLRPGSTEQVSQILQLANNARVGVVPQSGNTGLVGGQIPFETGGDIVISLSRMTQVRSVLPDKRHMIVEAGARLADVHKAAEHVGRLFPLAMASEGSCQIGGNLATNAGGLNVLAYGSARSLVSGIEVVLADGRVWNGLTTLKKDNSGYDLRDLFIGSEGTLGVITAAALKLFPRPTDTATAFLALKSLDAVARLFDHVSRCGSGNVTAFEFVPRIALEFVIRHVPGVRAPVDPTHPWYVLIETSVFAPGGEARPALEELVAQASRDGLVADGVIAASLKQAEDLWRLREAVSESQKPEGGSIKHDVSVPSEQIPIFVDAAAQIVERLCPGARPVPFGHFGDGNIHYNVSQPVGMERDTFLALWEEMNEAVFDLVVGLGGSISAEHGIGRMKRDALIRYKSEVELDMMRAVKSALDPNGILNPGKLL